MTASKGKVLMAMSGGVDSSTAAVRLLEEGYELLGVTMHLFCPDPDRALGESSCCSLDDIEDARAVARRLGFPHYVLNASADFDRCVIEPFCRSYLSGKTPNPCINCNRHLKFALLQQRRKELGCDYVATGHYARRIQLEDGSFALLRGADPAKDQSYVLYHLTQDTLAHMLFPLGDMSKEQTRALARQTGLENAQKGESQDICFVPDGDYARFIEQHAGTMSQPGPVFDVTGTLRGQHLGLIRYTIGQRKGLNLGGGTDPLYVVGKDARENSLIVGPAEALFKREVHAEDVSLVSGQPWRGELRCCAKIGYRMSPASAVACYEGGRLTVIFDEAVRAVSPGQSIVLYDGERVIGGGEIV